MKNLVKFIILFLAMIINPIIYGFVFSKLWFWFIVPIFQMQPLRIVEAIGILFIINLVTLKLDKEVNEDDFWIKFITNIVFVVLVSIYTLFSGWILTLFL